MCVWYIVEFINVLSIHRVLLALTPTANLDQSTQVLINCFLISLFDFKQYI